MFGCYRRDEAADPDTFVAAVIMIFLRYSVEVVEAVTDPFSGLPSRKTKNGYSGLPDVADIKEACENEASRIERMARYAATPQPGPRRLSPPLAGPGAWATIRVGPDAPQFAAFKKRAETADVREWRREDSGDGLWVSYSWFEANDVRKGLRQMTPKPMTSDGVIP